MEAPATASKGLTSSHLRCSAASTGSSIEVLSLYRETYANSIVADVDTVFRNCQEERDLDEVCGSEGPASRIRVIIEVSGYAVSFSCL